MPYTAPIVAYNSGASATWYTLSGIQSINISRGRQRFQDPVSQTSAVIELIPATSYTLDLAIGQAIEVRDTNADASNCYFQGRITDVQRSYAFPYNSSTNYAPADRIIVTAAGATGIIGTAQLNNYSLTAQAVALSIASIATSQQVSSLQMGGNGVTNSAQTITVSALDAINQLARTAQLSFDDLCLLRANPMVFGITLYPTGSRYRTIAFSDTGSGYSYTGLEFLSSVQNTFNWVSVQPDGLSAAVSSGTSPFNALNYSTYSASSGDASNLAGYLLNMLSGQQTIVPFTISTNTTVSSSCMDLAKLVKSMPFDTTQAVMGQPISVTFRGSTSNGSVIGVNSAFYADRATVQLFLSPSLGTPFTLDSTAFGVLTTNRLGYP
jgi:hypothetical protein